MSNTSTNSESLETTRTRRNRGAVSWAGKRVLSAPELYRLQRGTWNGADIVQYAYPHNDLPDRLLNSVRNSPTLGGCIERLAAYTSGEGVEVYTNGARNAEAEAWLDRWANGEGAHTVLRRAAYDLWVFGGFCLQVVSDLQGVVAVCDYQPWIMCRYGFKQRPDKLYDRGVYIAETWANNSTAGGLHKLEPVFYQFWTADGDLPEPNEEQTQHTQFLYYRRHAPDFAYYPLPSWWSAYKAAQTEIELINFKLQNVTNSFMPSGMFILPASMTPEERLEFIGDLKQDGTGTDNAGKILALTAEAGENPAYTPFTHSVVRDVNAYLKEAQENIIAACQLPSPTLIGLPGGASLGGDGGTIESASRELFARVIRPVQSEMLSQLNNILHKAGFEGAESAIVQSYSGAIAAQSEIPPLPGGVLQSVASLLSAVSATDATRLAPAAAVQLIIAAGIPQQVAEQMVAAQSVLPPLPQPTQAPAF